MENTFKKEKANYVELATRFNTLQERIKQDHAKFSTSWKITKNQRDSLEKRVQELETGLMTTVVELKNLKNNSTGTAPPALPKHPSCNVVPLSDPQ